MILVIDNYDSFTYNLCQYLGEMYPDILVKRNDEITLDEIAALHPAAIVISPGPGYPSSAGISVETVRKFSGEIPILGICLGHQSIVEAFGGKIIPARQLMHGKASMIKFEEKHPLFKNIPHPLTAGRYHSLIADESVFWKNLDANCIPHTITTMTASDYSEFLKERRVLMAKKIRDYYEKL